MSSTYRTIRVGNRLNSGNAVLRLLPLFLFSLLSCSYTDGVEDVLQITIPKKELVNTSSKIIAHRGAYRENELPENSLAAFLAALELDIYGSECDVRETRDRQLVVCHEATHDGMTISKTDYATLSSHPLSNGEPLPLLDDFLEALRYDHGNVRLVIELKSCDVTRLLNKVDSFGVLDRVDFISMSLKYCNELSKDSLGYKTFYVAGKLSPAETWGYGIQGVDYSHNIYLAHPEWIGEAMDMDMGVWVWTVNNMDTLRGYIERGVYVTTDYPAKARETELAYLNENKE